MAGLRTAIVVDTNGVGPDLVEDHAADQGLGSRNHLQDWVDSLGKAGQHLRITHAGLVQQTRHWAKSRTWLGDNHLE